MKEDELDNDSFFFTKEKGLAKNSITSSLPSL